MDNKIQRDQKSPTATSEESGAKAGGWEQKLGIAHTPCTHHYQRGWQTTSGTPEHTPTLTPFKEPAQLPLGKQASKGPCGLFLLPMLQ